MELTGQETVNALFFGTTQQPAGTWGSTASEAANQDDSRFTGSGILNVTTGAEPADNFETWIGGFGLAQGVQGPSDDPDHDGLNNLLESKPQRLPVDRADRSGERLELYLYFRAQ